MQHKLNQGTRDRQAQNEPRSYRIGELENCCEAPCAANDSQWYLCLVNFVADNGHTMTGTSQRFVDPVFWRPESADEEISEILPESSLFFIATKINDSGI